MMFEVHLHVLDTGGEADADMADRDSDSGSEGGEDESESDDQSDGEGDDLLERRGMGSRQDERDRDEERERGKAERIVLGWFVSYCMLCSCLCLWCLGRTVRFADVPQLARKRKKRVVKKTKAITPLQAMMLRMAGTHTSYIYSA